MGIISARSSGDTNKLDAFLTAAKQETFYSDLDMYAQQGVAALEAATPHNTGVTANSWTYEIVDNEFGKTIYWKNTNKDSQGTSIAILIQYGHGTGTGGYVAPVDFINPATLDVFDNISDAVWKAVQSA